MSGQAVGAAPTPTLARQIAAFARQADLAAMPAARQRRLAWCFADYLACTLAGSTLPEAASAFVLTRPGNVRIPGHAHGLDAPSAALAMGTLGALLQWHDGFSGGGNHPCTAVIPAVWAAADGRALDECLSAIAVGYEVANRLAAASHPAQTLAGTAPTSSTGAIGATAAVGRLLGLDEATLAAALGIAAFSLPLAALRGLTEHGSAVPLHGGLAARCALESITLACAGLSAGDQVLEGGADPGMLAVLAGDPGRLDPAHWDLATLDQVAFKPIPACRHAHPAIEAVLDLLGGGALDAAAIRQVDVHTYAVATRFGGAPRPECELYDRLMSLPWTVASALVHGRYDMVNLSCTDAARAACVQALGTGMHLQVDPAFEAAYPRSFGARVVVTLADGQQREGRCVLAYAEPGTPGQYSPLGSTTPLLDEAGMRAKFLRLAGLRLPLSAAEGLLDAIFAGTPPAP